MRIPIIAANWKMHKTKAEALSFVEELNINTVQGKMEVVICPPSPLIGLIADKCKDFGLRLGAQNMYYEAEGAYTGEVSPVLLRDLGVTYVIIGHSERRQLFGETDQSVAKKVKAAFSYDLLPIICVGETLEERKLDKTKTVVEEQVKYALSGLDPSQVRKAVIAYEPVWAIGSGLAATAQDAVEVISHIRALVSEMFSLHVAQDIRIQYGGSVKPENIQEFMQAEEIDGALVGGASLIAQSFLALLESIQGVYKL